MSGVFPRLVCFLATVDRMLMFSVLELVYDVHLGHLYGPSGPEQASALVNFRGVSSNNIAVDDNLNPMGEQEVLRDEYRRTVSNM